MSKRLMHEDWGCHCHFFPLWMFLTRLSVFCIVAVWFYHSHTHNNHCLHTSHSLTWPAWQQSILRSAHFLYYWVAFWSSQKWSKILHGMVNNIHLDSLKMVLGPPPQKRRFDGMNNLCLALLSTHWCINAQGHSTIYQRCVVWRNSDYIQIIITSPIIDSTIVTTYLSVWLWETLPCQISDCQTALHSYHCPVLSFADKPLVVGWHGWMLTRYGVYAMVIIAVVQSIILLL